MFRVRGRWDGSWSRFGAPVRPCMNRTRVGRVAVTVARSYETHTALEACQSTTRVRCAHTNSVCCLLPPLSQRTMPSDATSDQAIDALQRQLASSRQLASRLENELSNAKSDLATSRLKLANSQAELQNSRAALQKERNRPEPPPPPPPPPPSPPPPPPPSPHPSQLGHAAAAASAASSLDGDFGPENAEVVEDVWEQALRQL